MILVTSAAGHTGRQIVSYLVAQGFPVAATDINEQVTKLPGIQESLVGDLTDLKFQQQVVDLADQIVYIPPLFSPEEALIGKSLVDLSAKKQLQQFVFISVTHPILTSLLQHVAKRDVEEHLIYEGMTSQLPYTILQPMHYMHNFDVESVVRTDEYKMFYDIQSPIAYVDPQDVAEVVASVLDEPAKHDKATYELVGTQPMSPIELVDQFNELTGKTARAEYIPVADFLDGLNMQDLYLRAGFTQLADSYSKWGLDGNTNVLQMLLQREPTTFKDYLTRELAKL